MAFVPVLAIPIQLQNSTTSLNLSGGTLEFFLSGTTTPTNLFSDNTGTSIGSSITLNSGGFPESGGNVITLFRDSSIAIKIVAKDALSNTIFTSDGLQDALVLLASINNALGASLVGVEDSGGFFAAANVEAILADIGANFLKLSRPNTISATQTFSASILMQDNQINRPRFTDYAITHNAISSVSGVLTINLADANSFVTTLTENITTVTINNPPATGIYGQFVIKIIQDGAGGAHTVAWPSSVKWPSGTAPVITVTNSAIDEITLRTIDAGTEYRGSFSQAFA